MKMFVHPGLLPALALTLCLAPVAHAQLVERHLGKANSRKLTRYL